MSRRAATASRRGGDKGGEAKRRGTVKGLLGFLLVMAIVLASALLAVVGWRQAAALDHYLPAGATPHGGQVALWQRLWSGEPVARPALGADPSSLALRFEAERIHVADGLELGAWRIRRQGAPGVVLLFGDQGTSRSSLLPVASDVLEAGWEVLLVDMRGAGDSDPALLSLGWHEAADVKAVFERERLRRDDAIILSGQGAGAAAILRALHLNDISPSGLILDRPFGSLRDWMRQRSVARGLPPIPLGTVSAFVFGLLVDLPAFEFDPARWAWGKTRPRTPATYIWGCEAPRSGISCGRRDQVQRPRPHRPPSPNSSHLPSLPQASGRPMPCMRALGRSRRERNQGARWPKQPLGHRRRPGVQLCRN